MSKIVPGDPVNDVAKIVPADNPFVGNRVMRDQQGDLCGAERAGSVYVCGECERDGIFVNDVGQSTWEEIDLLKAGANYGWGLSEGFSGGALAGLGAGRYMGPAGLAYNHNGGPAGAGLAIIGG